MQRDIHWRHFQRVVKYFYTVLSANPLGQFFNKYNVRLSVIAFRPNSKLRTLVSFSMLGIYPDVHFPQRSG